MTHGAPVRVLYMEDDGGLARLFRRNLQRLGYVVDIAPDGEEGLAMYEAKAYDVVAVDQSMPGCSGLEVIQILASRGPLPPTIMVTGSGSEMVAVEAMKLGAGDYVVKDVDLGYLGLLPAVIEKVLQQHRLAEEKRRAEEEKERLIAELRAALEEVKTLSGLLPICASCKKIRNDQGYWTQLELYIAEHSEAEFTHGICPDCMDKLYPQFAGDYGRGHQERIDAAGGGQQS